MAYEGKGDMIEFVSAWNVILSALNNIVVIQNEAVNSPASMTFFDDKLVISFRQG